MKKIILTILFVVFVGLFLGGCSKEEENKGPYMLDNKEFTLNVKDNTIYDGRFTYKLTLVEYDEGMNFTVTYPDSSWWTGHADDGDSYIQKRECSDDYGDPRYATGEDLFNVYKFLKSEEKSSLIKITPVKVIVGAILIAIGVFMIAAPYKVWHIYEGWKFEEEVEPSGTYIGVTVVSGVFIIIMSVVLILFV